MTTNRMGLEQEGRLIAGCIIKSVHTGNSFTVEYVSRDGHCFVLEPIGLEKSRVYDMHDFKRSFELVSTPPIQAVTVPDGYALVPIEPTEHMVIAGFESEPDESFSEPGDWAKYDDMSGCEQAVHRAKLCWAAMISAAPKSVANEP